MQEEDITTEQKIHDVKLKEELSKRYLSYAMSTIVARSLPDVRDGLKPVHRRLMYAMRQLKLDPKSGFKKCARVVGDVIGKYHPHGDSAVYGAMVRLAQDFSVRYPLVDGQGNFGNIDGDGAAAMRYTEARLTDFAIALMDGLNENSVDFMDTYDGEEQEPVVMPAAVPNLLCNGSAGIAVGMATNIPPHNLDEVANALLYLIKNPECTISDLVKYVKGPDFPTGGLIIADHQAIIDTYTHGKGYFRIRAKWEKEDLGKGQYQIVITEIPYQVIKSKLIEKIAQLLEDKKLPLLADVRDESAHDVRIVLEPKNRTVDANLLMEHLFKQTELETRFAMNMNVLSSDGVPKVMSLKEVLKEYLNHRHKVLIRKSRFRLEKIMARLEILSGYLIAYLNLDEVIHIIRTEDEPKTVLMAKFGLTENQAEAILNMKLRNLRKLEEDEIRAEFDELTEEKNALEA
ncbi:MAG: DNA topoisomerase IV subunit A, partial [Alphaproteobacteria bacterium]|nr:DNA topoisomerase IV subunit A [Alphaproteobacteria bacterium]